MSKRQSQWRNKPTQELDQLISQATELKLYLIQENGPTQFVFRDDSDSKYKVSIGNNLSCSCNPSRDDHYNEIVDLMKSRFCVPQQNIQQRTNERKNIRKNKKNNKGDQISENNGEVQISQIARLKIDSESICPICHEGMNHQEGLTFCKKGCGNNFHLKCIMIWADHKRSIDDTISCPMCRLDWGIKALEALKEEKEEFDNRFIIHKGYKCLKCPNQFKNYIKGRLFKCVYCNNVSLCERCFLSYEHCEHDKFLIQEKNTDPWSIAKDRDQIYMESNCDHVEFVKNLKLCPQEEQLMMINSFTQQMASQIQTDSKSLQLIDNSITMEQYYSILLFFSIGFLNQTIIISY